MNDTEAASALVVARTFIGLRPRALSVASGATIHAVVCGILPVAHHWTVLSRCTETCPCRVLLTLAGTDTDVQGKCEQVARGG